MGKQGFVLNWMLTKSWGDMLIEYMNKSFLLEWKTRMRIKLPVVFKSRGNWFCSRKQGVWHVVGSTVISFLST